MSSSNYRSMPRRLTTALVIIVVLALIIFLRGFGYLNFFESAVRLATDTALKKVYQISLPAQSLEKNSTAELNVCVAEDTKIRLLEDENALLRDELHFFKKNETHVGAEVIGRDLDPLGTTIIINRGAADHVAINQPVIVGNGLLIGKIVRVDARTSVVRLLSDYESKVAATVLNRDKSLGLVEGGYGLTVKLDLIPQNEVIRPGDTIITSGLESGIPRGLVIGAVEVVEKKPQEPFQQAILKTSADLHNITVVSIIVQPKL